MKMDVGMLFNYVCYGFSIGTNDFFSSALPSFQCNEAIETEILQIMENVLFLAKQENKKLYQNSIHTI